ncbi:MAG: aminoacyl-tRNA hydrolase [Clostridia bacterium]|nr:aminoacyl-tRNA hydrolase [Clostridia bacterium]
MLFAKKATYDWLVVGLGNPGLQYENTRHNAGFMAVECFMKAQNGEFSKNKMDAVFGECRLKESRVLVAKPQTFMNNSGKAVSAIARFYKIPTSRIIIVCDDINLDIGKIRIRRKGSDGGQKGMRDIIELLGTDELCRIKVGVGKKPHPQYDLVDWVLSKFPKEAQSDLDAALEKSAKALSEIINRGIDSAMNKYSN